MNRPEFPHSISDVGATVQRIEQVVEHSIEHGVELAEESIARRFGNRALHGVRIALKTVAWLLVAAFFAFGALLLVTRYWILPRIDQHRPRIEEIASRALKSPVTIGRIAASWRGLNPHLALDDVRVGRDGADSLALPRVEATVSWSSLVVVEARFSSLRILAPELEVVRLTGGRYSIAGFVVDPSQDGGDSRAVDWILAQGRIAIRDARIRYRDVRQLPARELELTDVNLLLESSFSAHSLGLQATPPSAIAGPLDVRGRIRYDPLAHRSDLKEWSGELYAELAYADIAALARLADLPLDIAHAHGALRSWLSFDNAQITRINADLALKDVSARLAADLEPLALASLQGRVTMRRWDDDGPGGPGGQELMLNRLTFNTAAGLSFPPLDMKLRQTRAAGRIPQQTEIEASRINLEGVAALASHLPLPRELRDNITRHAIKGTLSNLTASWKGPTPEAGSIALKAQFSGLSSAGQPAATDAPGTETAIGQPGFENLTGSVEMAAGSGWLQLAAKDAVLFFPGMFEEKFGFDRLNASIRWKSQPAVELRIESLLATNRDIELNVTGSYRTADKGPGTADLNGRIVRFDVAAAHRYVPLAAGRTTLDWLKNGLVKGRLSDASLRLRGNLAQFPFRQPPDGEFRLAGRLTGVTLDVAPGAAIDGRQPAAGSVWPLLTGIDADIAFERTSMTINAQRGSAYGARIQNTSARVADLGRDAMLEVRGQAAGPLNDFVRYANASPVARWTAGVTAGAEARGDARLDLRLDIPLARAADTKAAGALHFRGNDLQLADVPPLSRVTGELNFTERGLHIENLTAGFVGGQVRVDASNRPDGNLVLTAQGIAPVAGLRRAVPITPVQRLLDRSQGNLRYTATLTVKDDLELRIDSDLVGLAIDGVAPLRKSAPEAMALRIERIPEGTERDELRVTLGHMLAMRFERQRGQGELRIARGVLALNEAPNLPERGILVLATLPRLDLEAWSALLASDAPAPKKAAPASGPQIDLIALRTAELVVMGRTFRNVTLGASRTAEGGFNANVASDNIVGYLGWSPGPAADPQSMGQVTAKLSKLTIPASRKEDVVEVLRSPPKQIPELEVNVEQFELGSVQLGRLDLVAQNVGTGPASVWHIRKLDVGNADMKLASSGEWAPAAKGGRRMQMKFTFDTRDAGATLGRLGYPSTMAAGQGGIEGNLQWVGSPFDIDYPTLAGKLALKLDNGRFLKVETGNAARLLSLLSLQSLSRTLAIDGGRQFAEGFAFSSIRADAAIANGVIATENFRMTGASAAVLMSGTVDLRNETQQLHIVVLPEIDASTAALALGVANPVLGLGTYLAQLVLRDPLSKAFALEYDVAGSWTEPKVTRRSRVTPPSPESAK